MSSVNLLQLSCGPLVGNSGGTANGAATARTSLVCLETACQARRQSEIHWKRIHEDVPSEPPSHNAAAVSRVPAIPSATSNPATMSSEAEKSSRIADACVPVAERSPCRIVNCDAKLLRERRRHVVAVLLLQVIVQQFSSLARPSSPRNCTQLASNSIRARRCTAAVACGQQRRASCTPRMPRQIGLGRTTNSLLRYVPVPGSCVLRIVVTA